MELTFREQERIKEHIKQFAGFDDEKKIYYLIPQKDYFDILLEKYYEHNDISYKIFLMNLVDCCHSFFFQIHQNGLKYGFTAIEYLENKHRWKEAIREKFVQEYEFANYVNEKFLDISDPNLKHSPTVVAFFYKCLNKFNAWDVPVEIQSELKELGKKYGFGKTGESLYRAYLNVNEGNIKKVFLLKTITMLENYYSDNPTENVKKALEYAKKIK